MPVRLRACGAGGNDIGLAFGTDAHAMAHFRHMVRSAGLAAEQRFEPVAMRFSKTGAQGHSTNQASHLATPRP